MTFSSVKKVSFKTLFSYILVCFSTILNAQEFSLPYLIQDICACDLDLDNDQDIIICCQSSGQPDSLFIFYNDGAGNFEISSINRSNAIFVLCGDIDNDTYPDIITKDGYNILFIKNNGDYTFGQEIAIAPTNGYKYIRNIADMNNDGLNDLVYSYSSMYASWGILKNAGDLNFVDFIIFDNGIGSNPLPYIGHLDGDNLLDVSVSYPDIGTLAYKNKGNFSFTTTQIDELTIYYPPILKLNTESPEDILLFSKNTDELKFLENLGSYNFLLKNVLPLIGPVILLDINDYNYDGYDDYSYAICWWANCTDSIYIMINDQNWSFHEKQQYYVDTLDLFKARSADLNGDGYVDLIMNGYLPRNNFKILWNDGFGYFTYLNPVSVKDEVEPFSTAKLIATPNPFRSFTKISINTIHESNSYLRICNIYGKIIKSIHATGSNGKTNTTVLWDGSDEDGNTVPSGMYFIYLSDNQRRSHTLKILKY